ncbi:MAG: GNAT family N-acetyltransferase [Rhodospirillales bacterium]|nr:GNAT family N-acetyltransferase [Rhodospirillales bacterium]
MTKSPEIDVVGCTVAHGQVMAALQAACFPEPWGAETVGRFLCPPNGFGFLACLRAPQSQPVGLALCRAVGGDSEILSLGVVPPHRKAGIGGLLLQRVTDGALERGAGRLFLEVAKTNEAGLALYEAKGFKQVGLRPGYFDLPEGRVDALVLALELNMEGN